jgi:hypothetical protein
VTLEAVLGDVSEEVFGEVGISRLNRLRGNERSEGNGK